MKKKFNFFIQGGLDPRIKKTLMYMRLTCLIILLGGIQAFAVKTYAQTTNISVNLKNATVEAVLQSVEEQTDFYFLYSRSMVDVDRKVDLSVKEVKVTELLNTLFSGTGISWKIDGRQIVLSGSEANTVQQQKTVTGKVTDSSGAPLPGVSVVLKGTTTGTITDSNGNYSILNIPADATLVLSFVGMKTQEFLVEGKSNINVVLEEEAIGIEEVVAIGYGTVRRKDLTGSVASVSGATFKDIPVTSAAQAIVGRMPGVQVTKTDGSPDADIKIRVRGGGSLTQDNSPLYIVDGFPVESIKDIAPTDIASIDILKDASSTAIYGARGANGVILVTTKSGSVGKGKVTYNTYFGMKKITKELDVLNPYEYVLWQFELRGSDSNFEKYFGDFQDYKLYKQMDGTNWQDEIFGRTGTSMYHNISFNGGSEKSKYNVSLTRNDEEEVMIGSGFSRTNLTVKTFHNINKWLTIDLNTRLSDYNLKGAGTSASMPYIVQFRPVDGLMDFVDYALTDDDFEASTLYSLNPLLQTKDNYRTVHNLSFNFSGMATIKFSKSLSYRFEYGTQYTEGTTNLFYGTHTYNVINYGYQPIASKKITDGKSYRVANILTYTKENLLPGSNVTAMLGEELNCYKSEWTSVSAKYFPKYVDADTALKMMTLGIADPLATGEIPDNKTSSFFGRVNYDYKGKYLASATLRADGSSKFAPGHQWGYFPSAALGWRISDEKFMSATKNWLNDLKVRASYGESGNNRISDDAWRKTYTVASDRLFMDGSESTPSTYLFPNSVLSNPGLKWETTITRNIGLDFALLKQRLSGTVEVYKNTTEDLLISATIPSNTGYTKQWQNIGQTSNRGLEISLNGIVCDRKEFKLSMSFNIGFNKNKIDRLGETKQWEQTALGGATTGEYLIKEGGELGQMYGYETDGMYTFDDFDYTNGSYKLKAGVSNSNALVSAVRFWPGTLKLKDQNGDLKVDAANDKVIIGSANPKHFGGFNLTAQYKGIDFSAFFNWVCGNDIYNSNNIYFKTYANAWLYKNILNVENSDNRFCYVNKETGKIVSDPAELAEMNKNATTWSPAMTGVPFHSKVVEDGSFLRLNNITIGYSLPGKILQKVKIDRVRLYVTAYNLWIWTKYSGYDPEVDAIRSTPLTPGVDYYAYPRSRSFNVGLNVEF